MDTHIEQAIGVCRQGGVIAYPTEAVFGLGCLPKNEEAVQRILTLKRRPIEKGLILVASSVDQLDDFIDFSDVPDTQIIRDSWPGPNTWLIPAKASTPAWLTGEHNTLAVRVSAHDLVRGLCEQLGPIVSTSANPAGETPAKSDEQVTSYFGESIDYIVPAEIAAELKPSQIRDALTGEIIRAN